MPVVGAIAGVGSALIGASSAKKAANGQSRAADQQYQLQKDIYEDTKGRFQPYEQAGNLGLQAYMHEMGLGAAPTVGGTAPRIETINTPATAGSIWQDNTRGPFSAIGGSNSLRERTIASNATGGTPASTSYRVGDQTFASLDEAQQWASANPTGGTPYGGFTATPGYDFRLQSGNDSINALAGARGGLVSGRTMQDLATFNQNTASDEYGNYMNRLAGLTDMGQASAGNQAQAGNAFAAGAGNALANKGNAQAAGYAGVGNALQQGISNGIGSWMYQQGLKQ